MNKLPLKIQKDIDYLLDFSADMITSDAILKDYDVQKVARIIDNLFGEFGSLEYKESMDSIIRWKEVNRNLKVPEYDYSDLIKIKI